MTTLGELWVRSANQNLLAAHRNLNRADADPYTDSKSARLAVRSLRCAVQAANREMLAAQMYRMNGGE